ncbi:MAG: transglutaminase domain-containing protein [Deltaproteobacteria bacterium]|nr:transglutaminase domain-containing protein [Deltaproteobacteria bacterium]
MNRLLMGAKRFLFHRGGLGLQVTIVFTWVVMMGLLVEKTLLQPEPLKITPVLAKEGMKFGEEWWGIYWKGEKIGYAVTIQQQQTEKVSVKEKVWLKLSVLGTPQNIEQTLEYQTNQNLILESFDFNLKSGLLHFRLAGRVEDSPAGAGQRLTLRSYSAGKERQQEIILPEVPYILGQTKLYFLAQGLAKGKKYRIPAFDPSTLSRAEMTAEVEGTEHLNIGGEEKELFRVREEFRGIVVKSWMDRSGEIWKEESPGGLVLLRESKNAARHQNWSRGKIVDLIALTAIPVKGEIENPRAASYLRAKILSPALGDLKIQGGRQLRIGNEVIIRKEEFPPKPSAHKILPERDRQEALRSTPFIQTDDPEIRRQAEAIVKGIDDPAEKVRRLAAWVHQELEKRPVVSIPSAVEVLQQKMGDCNEHTVLFAALVRASGIPAHMETGIIYQEGKFYYHSWAKVHLGAWVSVDPLLNQIPADATHIRLAEGDLDKQLDIVKVIGRMKIELLEVR